MSGMHGISGSGSNMPVNCGMQGMHGNEKAKVQDNIADKNSIKISQQLLAVNDGKGSKFDLSI